MKYTGCAFGLFAAIFWGMFALAVPGLWKIPFILGAVVCLCIGVLCEVNGHNVDTQEGKFGWYFTSPGKKWLEDHKLKTACCRRCERDIIVPINLHPRNPMREKCSGLMLIWFDRRGKRDIICGAVCRICVPELERLGLGHYDRDFELWVSDKDPRRTGYGT